MCSGCRKKWDNGNVKVAMELSGLSDRYFRTSIIEERLKNLVLYKARKTWMLVTYKIEGYIIKHFIKAFDYSCRKRLICKNFSGLK